MSTATKQTRTLIELTKSLILAANLRKEITEQERELIKKELIEIKKSSANLEIINIISEILLK